jgi:hypothetical protein
MSLIVPLNELASLVRRVVLLPARPVRPCPLLRPRPPRQAFLLPNAVVPVALLPVPPGGAAVVLVLMFLRRKKGYR